MFEVEELIRRFRLGQSSAQAARDLGINRKTAMRYRRLAAERGWLETGRRPDTAEVVRELDAVGRRHPPGPGSTLEPWRERIVEARKRGLSVVVLARRLREDHGYTGSYSSLLRFVRRLEETGPEICLRVETRPGEEAQVDFGSAGRILDPATGRRRQAWVFVMTLSWSRHQYAEVVWDQSLESWLGLHIRAFERLGGVVRRVVIDNLKSAVTKAMQHDVLLTRSYRELAEHYGFLVSPCRPATPRHKGKVESGVNYVKSSAPAGREFHGLQEANRELERWTREVAGRRCHGTTREAPLDRFEQGERGELLPLPTDRYEGGVWRPVRAHRDGYFVMDHAYYSVPYRLVGRKLMTRTVAGRVEVFDRWERVATHPCAQGPGQRVGLQEHQPEGKARGLREAPEVLQAQALTMGPAVGAVVEDWLSERPLDRVPAVQSLLGLARRFGADRLEQACHRARVFDEVRYPSIRRILLAGLDREPIDVSAPGPLPRTAAFARTAGDFPVRGGASWNS